MYDEHYKEEPTTEATTMLFTQGPYEGLWNQCLEHSTIQFYITKWGFLGVGRELKMYSYCGICHFDNHNNKTRDLLKIYSHCSNPKWRLKTCMDLNTK